MIRTNAATAVALAVVLLLAGCAGTDPGTTTADGTTPGDATATETTTAETTTATTSEATTTAEPTMNETEAELRTMVLSAIEDVASYREITTGNQTFSAGGVAQIVTLESTAVYDRVDRAARIEKTTVDPSGESSLETYVVDGRVYKRSRAYVSQYGSEWVTASLGGEFSSRWAVLDTISRQRLSLMDARFDLVGTDTIDGTDAYVVRADVNETSFNAGLDQPDIEVTNATNTVWIAMDSHRILRSVSFIESTVTSRGQEIGLVERIDKRFVDYGLSVSVSLPDEASDAIDLEADADE